MTEPDYKAFYNEAIGIADGLQFLVESGNLTSKESAIMSIIAEGIILAAEQHVPGGLHTQVFNINHKEG